MVTKPKKQGRPAKPVPKTGTGRVAGKRHSILAAVDFSMASRVALEAARSLALDLGADIVLLHASARAPPPMPLQRDRKGDLAAAGRAAAKEAATLSSEWAEELRADGIRVQAVNPLGHPVKEILDEADRRNVRAIVLGTTGRTGLKAWLLGSVAKEVLRRSKVPVLVAPVRIRKAERQAATKTILVAVDFSSGSEAAYEAGLQLARDLKARIHLLHASELMPGGAPVFPLGAEVTVELLEAEEARASGAVAELASKARAAKVSATPSVGLGHPASVILAEARQIGAAMIVVGTHGKSASRRFFLGSVAESVVQMADRPVLVVPDPEGLEAGDWVRSA